MSDLTTFAEHCRTMAIAQHKPECRVWIKAVPWPRYSQAHWEFPSPSCSGCVTDKDRALWSLLAAEVDDYLDPHPTLFDGEDR